MKRMRVTLLQMIGTIHHALKEDTMLQAEHVSGFMHQYPTASSEQEFLAILPFFSSVKRRVIPSEAKNPDTCS